MLLYIYKDYIFMIIYENENSCVPNML